MFVWTAVMQLVEQGAVDLHTEVKGYQWNDGRVKEHPFEYVPWGPCGAMSVSGGDMARFMLAHLNEGALGGVRGTVTSVPPRIVKW